MMETILTTWVLIMVLAIIFQVFLIDQAAYRLATQAHARLMKAAFAGNTPGTSYDGRVTEKLQGADEYVPVVGFFQMYGLTREDLHIRSLTQPPYDPAKRIIIGRGTASNVMDGVAGLADPSSYLADIEDGLRKAENAKNEAVKIKNAATSKPGRK